MKLLGDFDLRCKVLLVLWGVKCDLDSFCYKFLASTTCMVSFGSNTKPGDQRTTGPEDHGTREPRDQRTRIPEDRGTRGPETTGPQTTGPRTRRPQGHGLGQTFQNPTLAEPSKSPKP